MLATSLPRASPPGYSRSRWLRCHVASGDALFTKPELEEALEAIASTLRKCEKVQPKLRSGSSQHTLLVRRIKALQVAAALIERELGG